MTQCSVPTLLCAALGLIPLGCAATQKPQDTLDVKQLRIGDGDGVPQMVLAASVPGEGRKVKGAGIILNDAQGHEIGGLALVEKSHTIALCFDYAGAHSEAICMYRFGDGLAGIAINDPAAAGKHSGSGKERLRFDVDHGKSTVVLSDKNEKPRIRLSVDASDTARIELLDADGKIVYALPPRP